VNLLLNATPDSHGEVPAAQMKRLQEFGNEIRARFTKPLFTTRGEGNNISLDFGSEQTIDHIVLREDIRGGERIRKFLVEGRRADGTWLALARGTQVGSRQIIPIPATAVTGLRLTVQESVAPFTIRELSAFHVNRPVPKLAYREDSTS
jgi:alpha-L-fucosidase